MEFSALLGMVIFIKYIAIFRSLKELSVFWKVYGHLFEIIRFWLLKFPNAWTKFFVLICSAFRRFLLGIEYFLTLLNPLFPRVPVLTVVKYGVKNASWPGAAGVCQPRLGSVFSWEKLLGFQQLLDGIHGRPLIPDLRIVIRLSAAHPAGAVDLSLGQPSGGAVFPCKDIFLSPKLTEDRFLAMDRAHTLLTIVTAVSVQLCSLLDSSGHLQESSRNMLSYRQPICQEEKRW